MSRNKVMGSFEDTFERGRTDLSNVAKQTVKDFTNSAKGQITGSAQQNSSQASTDPHSSASQAQVSSYPPMDIKDGGTNESSSSSQNQQSQPMSDQDRVDFLRDLYGKNDDKAKNAKKSQKGSGSVKQALGVSEKDPNASLSPEEKAKLETLRMQLHGKYYQDLINRPKPKEEPVTEKLEREDQEAKFEDLEKQKKKPAPLPSTMKQGTGESVVGVSG